jgi:hypothetical protein
MGPRWLDRFGSTCLVGVVIVSPVSIRKRTYSPQVVGEADVVLATLGATTALAGFTLVFLGVVITRYEGTIPEASARVRRRFVGPAEGLLGAFMVGLATVGTCFAWLVGRGGHAFYLVVVALFAVQLVSTALASGYITRGVLLKR